MTKTTDTIDHLVGITPESKGEALRVRRPVTKEQAQKSWLALFSPVDVSQVSLAERFAVASFVAELHGDSAIADFYSDKLVEQEGGSDLLPAIKNLAELGATKGPYGHYPAGPLTPENVDGPILSIATTDRAVIGERLATALEHTHLLVFRPRDARPAALQALLSAGWSTTGIVTLSQLVSFLAFQVRVITGLKALSAA